jgi:hypothetical protein
MLLLCAVVEILARVWRWFRGAKIARIPMLRVGRWAALCVHDRGESQETFGEPVGDDTIPAALRRRMGRLERLAVRCTLGVLGGEPTAGLIFCSRYGNVETLTSMLRTIAEGQATSPMAFSGSVHNAAPGLVGQIRKERLSHTAVSAGSATFLAGLVEAFAKLVSDDCCDVTLTFADLALPDAYDGLEEEIRSGLVLAMRLSLGQDGEASPAFSVREGRRGVFEVLEKVRNGPVQLSLEETPWASCVH